jgi:dihydroorotate dehydrogenase
MDAERAHGIGLRALGLVSRVPWVGAALERANGVLDERLQQPLFGRTFQNPIGLAAGFDKNAEHASDWRALGFGFVEVGTVTVVGQRGNAKPRLFRLEQDRSLQNAMGFNNDGANEMVEQLAEIYPLTYPLGVNLGKNRETPLEQAEDEYIELIGRLEGYCDYFVINLSSPNTPGLRELENARYVRTLVDRAARSTLRPVMLKVSPDREPAETVDLATAAIEAGASGIIATNTTVDYSLTPRARNSGGISGALLRDKSRRILKALSLALGNRTVLVSVGGIDSAEEAYRRIRDGASLVQLYSGLIYEGPGLVRRMNEGLLDLLERDGLGSIAEAIGANRAGAESEGPSHDQ